MDSQSPDRPLLLRRNGRPAACNPCRARKVACDHSRPTCRRCLRRKQGDDCVYPDSSTVFSSRGRTLRSAVDARTQSQSQSSASPGTGARRPPALTCPALGHGYLGYTSHREVFDETQSSLFLAKGPSSQPRLMGENGQEDEGSISFRELPRPLQEMCLSVLRCLPGQVNEQMVFLPASNDPKGSIHVAVDRIVEALQGRYSDLLNQGELGLERFAEILCNNGRRQIQDDHSSARGWMDQFCDVNMRWESLGLLWAHLERVSDVLDALKSRRVEYVAERRCPEVARACLGYCIEIARNFTDGNDILLDLIRRKTTLDTMIEGEARISSWMAHGAAATMLTYLGLHILENGSSYTPSLCSENKRRLVAQIFSSDTLGVAFTGRPPLLSRRYFSTPLPLDIRDEDMTDNDTMMNAFRSLDERGWNTDGGMYPTTVIRARTQTAFVRDELFEIALSKGSFVDPDHLRSLKERQLSTWAGFPESLIYHPDSLSDPQVDMQKMYIRIIIRLDHLKNIFFAERLLLRHGEPDGGDVLITSFDMVTICLKLWMHKDRFDNAAMRRNFSWLLMEYGAPGGGILCQELLRPTFTGAHPKEHKLTRSSIVQQLSLLCGFLDWVHPSAPNGDLAASSREIIQHVLDHHLNAPSQAEDNGALDSMDWGFLAQPDFSFELLDTFDWMRTSAP